MASRAAAALFDEYRPDAVYELARKVYDHRSEIAHGSVKTNPSFTYDGYAVNSPEMAPLRLRLLLAWHFPRLNIGEPCVKRVEILRPTPPGPTPVLPTQHAIDNPAHLMAKSM
jgi:hypothetical protein